MVTCHQLTIHTPESVRSGGGLDWSGQPRVFKQYPDSFSRISLADRPELRRFFLHCAGLTARRVHGTSVYFLRANPSAGALYPCELYVQARSVAGLADGIYHYEPLTEQLCLLHEPNEDGLESCCRDHRRVEGLVLLVSVLYYRSSWKYRRRAIRYCLLDSGHLLGGVEAAAVCCGREIEILCRLDRKRLATCFGFGHREMVVGMAVCGTRQEVPVRPPAMHLPPVDGTGSFVREPLIEQWWEQIARPADCRPGAGRVAYPFSDKELARAIVRRRSIREFSRLAISRQEYETVLQVAGSPLCTDCDEPVRILAMVNRVDGLEPGVYGDGRCLLRGDFSQMAGYLCLEQALGADSGATLFFTGNSENYLPLLLRAGLIGQRIYLAATGLGFGCSGIGAFYDLEVARFLETDDMILYGMAIGR